MKTRFAVIGLALALGGCAGNPRWDYGQFPPQPTYAGTGTATAEAPK